MMQQTLFRAGAAFVLTTVIALGAAQAQERVAANGFWATYVQDTDNGKVCWIASSPVDTDTSGSLTGREDAFLMVSYRPAENVREGEVSLISGYPYQAGGKVSLTVDGGSTYSFFTAGDGAWLEKPEDEGDVITAMRRGSTAVVKGASSASVNVTDEFNLSGFTAASNAARRACGL